MAANPIFGAVGEMTPPSWAPFGAQGPVGAAPFVTPITNFYMTDPISRASKTMQQCTEAFVSGQKAVKHG